MTMRLEELLPNPEGTENDTVGVNANNETEKVETAFDEYVKTHADNDGNIEILDSKGNKTKVSVESLKKAPDMEARHIATIEQKMKSLDDTIEKLEQLRQKEFEEENRQTMLETRVIDDPDDLDNIECKNDEKDGVIENVEQDEEIIARTDIDDSDNIIIPNTQEQPERVEEENTDVDIDTVEAYENNETSNEIIHVDEYEDSDRIIRDEVSGEDNDDDIPEPESIDMSYSKYIKLQKEKKKKKKVIDINSIKIKKKDKSKKDIDNTYTKLINNIKNRNICREVLPISGYIVNMAGLSSIELRNIEITLNQMKDSSTTFELLEYKYRLVYDLISKCTLGKLTFTQFLKNTALVEFDLLLHGIYTATHGDLVTFPRTCEKCSSDFVYNIKSNDMIYVTKDDREEYDKMYNEVIQTGLLKTPTLLNKIVRVQLEDCGILVDIKQPTLYNQLYDVSKHIRNDKDEDSAIMNAMPFIKRILVPDTDGEYIEIKDFNKIFDILSKSLSEEDDFILGSAVTDLINTNKVKFVTKAPACPKCGHVPKDRISLVTMESMVFLVHQMKLLMRE